jgi:hypothetical protein
MINKRVGLEKTIMICRDKNPTTFKSTLQKEFYISTSDFVLAGITGDVLQKIANSLKTKITMAESFE